MSAVSSASSATCALTTLSSCSRPTSTAGRCAFARWTSTSRATTAGKTFICPSSSRKTPRSPSSARNTSASEPLSLLLHDMTRDQVAPPEKVRELREGLAEHYGRDDYLRCESMGALIRENLESIRRHIGRPVVPELVSE